MKCSCGEKHNILAIACQRCGHICEAQAAVLFLIIVSLFCGSFLFVAF